ncbi:Crp/Fnr family transcriptional regulator [Novosphingobium resinovorum]|uniref:Crp/Fnr family transcriptional regulator n=1 Tax=Novosphingobium TaxID=165696 RepID=UPI001B3CA333|nr:MULTISPECIES: Crp/Fnr family transcriptional regulator [Novosphingobium]MBF7013906.1 Crp/Fnr family transcriptional regulator [Novosphingobium sp. HR1a]WJM26049.1 Crp/Fnr family transcriptional regulator [Novosphingobium resinovorum]
MLHEALLNKLASIHRLSGISENDAKELCANVHLISRRDDIISEGSNPNRIHILLSGWAARYNILRNGSRRITGFLLPGDFGGVHSTVLQRMDHGILALTECRVAFVQPERINEIAVSTPGLVRALWRSSFIDEAILRRWLVTNGRGNAIQSVGHLLSEIYLRAGRVGLTRDQTLELPITQEEIGDATGLTHVHVNRVLRHLREEKIATVKGGTLFVKNEEALWKKSGFNPDYLYLSDLYSPHKQPLKTA